MENGKVLISREVAEAIESLRKDIGAYTDDANFIEAHAEVRANPEECYWAGYPILSEVPTDVFARAILNGYEIEKSQAELEAERKENVREYYVRYENDVSGIRYGIRQTLDILGIKIEGVNAE